MLFKDANIDTLSPLSPYKTQRIVLGRNTSNLNSVSNASHCKLIYHIA